MTQQHTVSEISEIFFKTYGFACSKVYCERTGKPMGFIFAEELESIISSIPGTAEEVVDDLALRLIASLRPSMKWNRLRDADLNEMRKQVPHEVMAWLLGRLIEVPFQSREFNAFSQRVQQIKIYAHLAEFAQDEDFDSLMVMLLEIESKLNLVTEDAPIDSKIILSCTPAELVAKLTTWHIKRVDYHRKQEIEARFFVANPGARRAFANSWMEQKPKSEATIRSEVKQADQNFMGSFLDAMLSPLMNEMRPASMRVDAQTVEEILTTTHIAPSTKMPSRFSKKAVG